MDSVRRILEAQGYKDVQELEVNETIKIDPGPDAVMPLTIEKLWEYEDRDRISVAHYYTQRGDLMSDPEIVFDVPHGGGDWVPVRYTHHPYTEQYDSHGLGRDVQRFVELWDENLRSMGYVQAALENRGGEDG